MKEVPISIGPLALSTFLVKNPPKLLYPVPMPYWLCHLLLLAITGGFPTAASYTPSVEYSKHCSSYVQESEVVRRESNPARSLAIHRGSVTDGDSYLRKHDVHAGFTPKATFVTRASGTLRVDGELEISGNTWTSSIGSTRRAGRLGGRMSIRLSGFWSETSGMLCMVGTGQRVDVHEAIHHQLSARFLMNLPKSSNISTSLVTGLLQSLDDPASPNHFQNIRILFYAPNEYQYTLLPQEAVGRDSRKAVDTCNSLTGLHTFLIDYGDDCENRRCGPFYESHGELKSRLGGLQCSHDGRMNLYMLFPNSTYIEERRKKSNHSDDPMGLLPLLRGSGALPLHPSTVLVLEGLCEGSRCRLTACRVRDLGGLFSVHDCTIEVTIEFPPLITVKNTSRVVGEILSRNNDFLPIRLIYDTVGFNSFAAPHEELKYKFTMLEDAEGFCSDFYSNATSFSSGAEGVFPDKWSSRDLSFSASVSHAKEQEIRVEAAVLSIGETIMPNFGSEDATPSMMTEMSRDTWKIGYEITSDGKVYISAEGYYYSRAGLLCLVGCMNSTDCEIGVVVRFAAADISKWGSREINGTIRSRRSRTDSLYFEPLPISSSYLSTQQARRTARRMDAEVIMVVVSMTLLCLLIRKQILYARRNPQSAASISISMQALVVLGIAVPLLLDFETLLLRRRTRNYILLSAGWKEANEVIVRTTTTIALLLQLRLLQVVSSLRSTAPNKENLSVAERRALQLCLPIYLVGFSIAWAVGATSGFDEPPPHGGEFSVLVEQRSILSSVLSFSGLLLDGFLLPQIVLNVLASSKDRPLSEAYYLGTTMIRAAPHLYDIYRARFQAARPQSTLIYANPSTSIYSTVPDIVVPLLGTVFALTIWVQQRSGGRYILPQRFRRYGAVVPPAAV